jgi:hypothetical protein
MSPLELQSLASALNDDHSETAKLACLVLLTERALSRLGERTAMSVEPLIELGLDMIDAYVEREQLSAESLTAAIQAIQRAGITAKYLSDLPP